MCFLSSPGLVLSAAPSAGWKWACHEKLCESCLNISIFGVDAGFHRCWRLTKGPDWSGLDNPGDIVPNSSCSHLWDYILSRTFELWCVIWKAPWLSRCYLQHLSNSEPNTVLCWSSSKLQMQQSLYDEAMLRIFSIMLTAPSLSLSFTNAQHSSLSHPWAEPKDSQEMFFFFCDRTKRQSCYLSLLFRDLLKLHLLCLVLTFLHGIWKEYAVYPDLDTGKIFPD